MSTKDPFGADQPNYSKYAELGELSSRWQRFLQALTQDAKQVNVAIIALAIAMLSIARISNSAFSALQENGEAWAILLIAVLAFLLVGASILAVVTITLRTRRINDGETCSNCKDAPKFRNVRGYQGKSGEAKRNNPGRKHGGSNTSRSGSV